MNNEHLLEEVTRHLYLVHLHVSWPKMRKQLKDAKIVVTNSTSGVDTEVDQAKVTKPQLSNMPTDWADRFRDIEDRARKAFDSKAEYLNIGGTHALPVTEADAVFSELERLRGEFLRARDAFAQAYPKIYDDNYVMLKNRYGAAQAQKIMDSMPAKDRVHEKFAMRWPVLPIGGSGGTPRIFAWQLEEVSDLIRPLAEQTNDPSLLDAMEKLNTHTKQLARQLGEIAAEDLMRQDNEIVTKRNEFAAEVLNNLKANLMTNVQGSLTKMMEALSEGRNIRNLQLEAGKREITKALAFKDLLDEQAVTALQTMQTRLGGSSAEEVNADTGIGRELGAVLGAGLELAAEELNRPAGSRRHRRVNIRRREEPSNA